MEIGYVVSELWRMRRLVAIGLLVAFVAALSVMYKLPSLDKKSYEAGAAATEVIVEPAGSPLGLLGANAPVGANLVAQTGLYARLLSTEPVTTLIEQKANLPRGVLAATTDTGDLASRTGREIAAESRANELLVEGNGYRIRATPGVNVPFISLYAQAPTAEEAVRIANASVISLRRYVEDVSKEEGQAELVKFRQLGFATGGLVTQNASRKIAGMTFIGTFIAWAVLVLLASRIKSGWRAARESEQADPPAAENVGYLPGRDGDDLMPPTPVQTRQHASR